MQKSCFPTAKVAKKDVKCEHLEAAPKRSPIFLNILVALPWGCSSHKCQPTRKIQIPQYEKEEKTSNFQWPVSCQLVVFAVFEPFRTCQLVSPAVRLLWQQKRSDAFVTSGNKPAVCKNHIPSILSFLILPLWSVFFNCFLCLAFLNNSQQSCYTLKSFPTWPYSNRSCRNCLKLSFTSLP